ncbi:MAG: SDR family NAD(P)-dependent oxidoreductase [Acidimicrobiaceae bacterium]|nr:SDR family NAD(P)-dependent oxidoreductase [Acidimicrobiaceae bacterium]MBO0748788.1 SDR family NAD(P)-dependent oxidoreductase [Acidimicrobiaceae bacterium]
MSDKARVVAITGAAGGIGAAIARRFAAAGDRLFLLDRRPLPDDLAAELDGIAAYRPVDISSTADVALVFEEATAELGPVEVLVNNAGIGNHRKFVDMTEVEWDEMIAVNLKSVFNTCRVVVPEMIRAGRGKIVNVASELGLIGAVSMTHYSASKGGVIAFSKALARELSRAGVHVNVVAPGPIETPLLTDYPEEYNDQTLAGIPLGRWGQPDDVAATVEFVASAAADYYVGWVFSPNGGVVM